MGKPNGFGRRVVRQAGGTRLNRENAFGSEHRRAAFDVGAWREVAVALHQCRRADLDVAGAGIAAGLDTPAKPRWEVPSTHPAKPHRSHRPSLGRRNSCTPHLWCICVKPSNAAVRPRESHASLGALRRVQIRQETSRFYLSGGRERGSTQRHLPRAAIASNPVHRNRRTNAGRPRRHPARRAANIKVERPQRSEDDDLDIRRAAGHLALLAHDESQ